ncbi:metallopeptidase TldD-related protein [Fusibacter ferrireducens]|uniref:Metalloprotease TldD/E C-terminal domain-containing protein n=1 Tax=Fusibacter ferrireducens TaxID=2785058 RepID=A0ABS0A0S0_9FIRM|nr:metallopeptidase TldD-related protein [Fusibacter ferrireducens]MBF4695745.1 hypothetical protein [Fusibacter ferrireducens]
MKKEFVTVRQNETVIKVLNTKIDAVRVKDLTKRGVRVYENGLIGISGAIGNLSDDALVAMAKENLSVGIKYPYELTKQDEDHRDYRVKAIDSEQLVSITEQMLTFFRMEFPEFDFSEKIGFNETQIEFNNSEGLELSYQDAIFEIELILKEKSSSNLFDGFISYQGRTLDMDKFVSFNKMLLRAQGNAVLLPRGEKLPIFMTDTSKMKIFLNKALNGENYANNSSIFSQKMGQKIFNSKLTIEQNFDPTEMARPFFDHEGVKLNGDKLALIENGVLKDVFSDKKTAAIYGIRHTGGATGEYDSMPMLSATSLRCRNDSENIKKVLNGKPAIIVAMAEGGDFTADGHYASPVQLGYLFDGEKIIGKLPEFTVTSKLSDMLGDDYIGTFENPFYMSESGQLQGYYLTVK